MQSNIINVIFVKDGNHFYFYSQGSSWCQNLLLGIVMANTRQTDDVTL